MLFYFVVFCAIGFVIGLTVKNIKVAVAAIVILSLCWALVYGPWALATFIELMIGYSVAKVVQKELKD